MYKISSKVKWIATCIHALFIFGVICANELFIAPKVIAHDARIVQEFVSLNKPVITVETKLVEYDRHGTDYFVLDKEGNSVSVTRGTYATSKKGDVLTFMCDQGPFLVTCIKIEGGFDGTPLITGWLYSLLIAGVIVLLCFWSTTVRAVWWIRTKFYAWREARKFIGDMDV
jgi:hypothetical protein